MWRGAADRLRAQALTAVRLGLFGGTFDPPHVGHLLAASDAFEALALDRLAFVPAAQQPFKQGAVIASAAQRVAMLERMVDGDGRFVVDALEIERGGISFTVDTLATVAAREPASERFLLVGEDLAAQMESWREPARIASLATIAVLTRGAESGAVAAGPIPMQRVRTRRVDVSSTEVRTRVRAGLPIRGFVTDAVAAFIETAGLYR